MIVKQLEIRDRGTFIPALAIQVTGHDGPLIHRAGFGDRPLVLLINLARLAVEYDPYGWNTGARTMLVAHRYIEEHFADLVNGSVICVEHILGERATPKPSELAPDAQDFYAAMEGGSR